VDLDGTLAHDPGVWQGRRMIGHPIPRMVERVRAWLKAGYEVRIMTARLTGDVAHDSDVEFYVGEWCEQHIGQKLPVTNKKDHNMIELWDDRAIQVEHNTGRRIGLQSVRGLVIKR
jgi:hypothetical protein